MAVRVTNQDSLAGQLNLHMTKASTGDARLAKQTNSIVGNPYFIHRSTIRNWRDGSAKKVNNWRQLIAVAQALRLDETAADSLLESAGCPPIRALQVSAQGTDQRLLEYWRSAAGNEQARCYPEANAVTVLPNPVGAEGETAISKIATLRRSLWDHNIAGLFVAACLVGALTFLLPNGIQGQSASLHKGNLLVNSGFEQGMEGWISFVKDEAEANFEIKDEAMHLQIGGGAAKSWHIALNQKDLVIKAGEIYTAKFRLRGDGKTSMNVDITRVKRPMTSVSSGNSRRQQFTTKDSWTTHMVAFEANETVSLKDGGARLFFTFGNSEKGLAVLDDIEFFEGKLD